MFAYFSLPAALFGAPALFFFVQNDSKEAFTSIGDVLERPVTKRTWYRAKRIGIVYGDLRPEPESIYESSGDDHCAGPRQPDQIETGPTTEADRIGPDRTDDRSG